LECCHEQLISPDGMADATGRRFFMSRRDYLPEAETEFASWCRNFVQHVAADPARFGLEASDAAALESALAAFEAASATASAPSTRTSTAVVVRNEARAALERLVRAAVHRVQAFPGVDAKDRISLGLSLRNPRGSRIGPPKTRPVLVPDTTPGGSLPVLRLFDEAARERIALPKGVMSAIVFTCVCPAGSAPPPELDGWRFEGVATKNFFPLPVRPADAGRRVYAVAVWVSPRGQLGPVSAPLLLSPGVTLAAAA
jgi:hypothetical protein